MANPALVKTANGIGLSLNGVTVDPFGATTPGQALTWDGSKFVPGTVVSSVGNFTFSGNNLDINNAGTLGVGLTTAATVTVGKPTGIVFLGGSTSGSGLIETFNPFFISGIPSTSGTTLRNSPALNFNTKYWTGVDNNYSTSITAIQESTAPAVHLSVQFNGTEKFQLTSGGVFYVPSGGTIDTLTAGALFIGQNVATTVNIGTGAVTGTINIGASATDVIAHTSNTFQVIQNNVTHGTPSLYVQGGALTGIAASTEQIGIYLNQSALKTWQTGSFATQREVVIAAPTYAFAAPSTITNAATLSITGAPGAGANATITNAYALMIESGNVLLNGATAMFLAPSASATVACDNVRSFNATFNLGALSTTINIGGAATTGNIVFGSGVTGAFFSTTTSATVGALTQSSGSGRAGVTMQFGFANGAAASGATAAGAGGQTVSAGGTGGAATTTAGGAAGAGGQNTITGGIGGSGAASTNVAGAGGAMLVTGGNAGANNGAGGNSGGTVFVRGGAATTGGTNGQVVIGDLNTSLITLGLNGGAILVSSILQGPLAGKVATVASASTIAPVNPIVHVTGTAAIATITPPTGFAQSGGGGQLTLIPDGAFTTTTGGNIALATTAVVNRALIMTYDNATAKWYPSY